MKFRSEPHGIIHGYLRNEVRDAISRVASTYEAMDILGERRAEFLDAVKTEVTKQVGDWWVVDYITFATKLRLDPRIENSINTIIEQTQQTAAAELKVKQIKAQADQAVAQAEGEAKAISIQASAIQSQGGQNYVQLEWIKRWNGKLPETVVNGNSGMMLNMGK